MTRHEPEVHEHLTEQERADVLARLDASYQQEPARADERARRTSWFLRQHALVARVKIIAEQHRLLGMPPDQPPPPPPDWELRPRT